MNKKLIVNADDFGVTAGVNEAIIACHNRSSVTSASIMTNMWAFGEAIELAKSNPSLGVGLHFTLAAGKPVSPSNKVMTLVDKDGMFLNRRELAFGLMKKRVSLDEVKREFYAQAEKLEKAGLRPDHIDGDKHVHILPGIAPVLVELAKELDRIPVRVPDEHIVLAPVSLRRLRNLKTLALLLIRKTWAKRLKNYLRREGISSNDGFISIFGMVPRRPPCVEDMRSLIAHVREGVTEFMVHPGKPDPRYAEFFGGELAAQERETELRILLSREFATVLEGSSIELVNYGYLNGSKAVI